MEEELFNEQIQIERKQFSFSLRDNPRGLFLRITEDVGGRRDAVMIPATGLQSFHDVLERAMLKASGPVRTVRSNPRTTA